MRTEPLVVGESGTTRSSAADLWAVWSDLEHWPTWSPNHRSVALADANALALGGSFDQELGLGFPVGVQRERATFDAFEPAVQASFRRQERHPPLSPWRFQPMPDGGTRIHNIEIFVGTTMGLGRPLVGRRWNRLFQRAVDGLIAAAEGSPHGR